MPKASKGVLITCDPSVKAMIIQIDEEKHEYIIEDLDEETLVIKETQLQSLKQRLKEKMDSVVMQMDESDSDSDTQQRKRKRK